MERPNIPLPERLRPHTLDEYVGQEHLDQRGILPEEIPYQRPVHHGPLLQHHRTAGLKGLQKPQTEIGGRGFHLFVPFLAAFEIIIDGIIDHRPAEKGPVGFFVDAAAYPLR